jgi:hypothetical protein
MDSPSLEPKLWRARIAGIALVLLAACGDEPDDDAPAVTWPPGTILALDGVPISIEEVDAALVPVHLIEPSKSDVHKQRLALTNVVLPRAIARLLSGERRAAARALIDDLHRRAQAGLLPGPSGPHGEYGEWHAGQFRELGLVAWGAAFDLLPGEWSPVLEDTGSFLIVRVLGRTDGPVPEATQFELDVLREPYLPPGIGPHEIEAKKDELRLTIVDPAWRTIVPERDQYRMGAHR